MTSICKLCKRRYKTLTDEQICFYCHVDKYKVAPSKGIYSQEKKK